MKRFYKLSQLNKLLEKYQIKKYLLVCGNSFEQLSIKKFFVNCKIPFAKFTSFTSNPKYEEVCAGIEQLRSNECNGVIAIGGGSAIDVAKCIKVFSSLDYNKNYLEQQIVGGEMPLFVLPTTAGTGSEVTQFAVIYNKGSKVSVDSPFLLPDVIFREPSVLQKLPLFQKKCTVMDSLCHAIESWWSINSTKKSISYSKKAIKKILANMKIYFSNNADEKCFTEMFDASNLAGKAINITRTTAAHAMCYKLTSLYDIPHGNAAILCLPKIWKYMNSNLDKCIDNRGGDYLKNTLNKISKTLKCKDSEESVRCLEKIIEDLELRQPRIKNNEDIKILTESVNLQRLKNNPVILDSTAIENIYKEILGIK